MIKDFKILPLLISMTIFVSFACQSKNTISQSNSSNGDSLGNTLVIQPQSNIHSKICGAMYEVRYNGEDAESFIMSQPLPEMWIVEKSSNAGSEMKCDGAKISLSDKSKKFLQQHWEDRLEYNFLHDFVEPKNGVEGISRDTKLSKSYLETKRNLEESTVGEAGKVRNITSKESEEILIFIRDSANTVSQAVKNKIQP